ncbi:YopX family protein [Oceanobacillus indicireducens]|uniref:YopX protein domain-containing protein n=1 Tax=Oceanobacillus indicireducens TaxID=1004261 RepID=A0A918D4L2_9BACI|nr:YopX family protein [Oceanobacillus indicireducens]GGN64463.1 hypothetical protein GCM10007971_32380 [Oceanobacillus indicireducens]
MREIKYQAWDVKRKTMYSNEDLVFYDQENTCLYSILTDSADEQLIFMQYTGLKDKNGKGIYEGDEFHLGDPRITYTVVWHDTGFMGKQNGASSFVGLSHWKNRIEIIGNIYETQNSWSNSHDN